MNITDLPDRLQKKIVDTDSCWQWVGAVNNKGYGCTSAGVAGQIALAHRFVYELLVAPIPEGLTLDHLCLVKTCVNPGHLEPVTHAENVRRSNRAYKVCRAGHKLDSDNLAVEVRGKGNNILCRACRAKYMRDYRAARKAAAA